MFSWSEIVLLAIPFGGLIAGAAGLASLGDPATAFCFGCPVALLYAATVLLLVPAKTVSIFHHVMLPSFETMAVLILFPLRSVAIIMEALVVFTIFLMLHRLMYNGQEQAG